MWVCMCHSTEVEDKFWESALSFQCGFQKSNSGYWVCMAGAFTHRASLAAPKCCFLLACCFSLIPEDLWNLDLNPGQDIQDCQECQCLAQLLLQTSPSLHDFLKVSRCFCLLILICGPLSYQYCPHVCVECILHVV